MFAMSRDLNSAVTPAYAGDAVAATAGGTGDATAAPGVAIDLTALADRFESVDFQVAAKAVLAANKALAVSAKIETSADNNTWSDLVAASTILTLTDSGAGSTLRGVGHIGVPLEYASRYIRLNITPDLSAANTDTAALSSVAIFGGRRKSA